ncbi:serine hydrolase domain-containing protein [Microbacterium sp. ZW T5_56]|uniref:serine hydrolase domain-containing protein n=1 Tax=Microbacterium sp. ZW T5_56 TaxID=3378081 RepID=UPI003854B9A8
MTSGITQLIPHLSGFLDDWIERQRVIHTVPGIQVAVRIGAELLYSRAFGVADTATGETLDTEHVFRIASHSKTFTATAIMKQVEGGRLRLDDTVAQHVPELADAPLGSSRIRELLGHQSGAERDGRAADFWQREAPFLDRDGLIAQLQHDRVFPANTHFHYSNLAYSLLGLILEAVTGTSYDAVIRDLLRPMSDAMTEPVRIGPELGVDGGFGLPEYSASGHGIPQAERGAGDDTDRTPPVIPPVDTRAESAATGFWANAETASAWVAAHALGTGLFLTDDTKRLMQRDESQVSTGGTTRWYGLGWIIRKIGDRRVIGHSGGFPGHITQTWADPKTGLAVSVLTNRIDGPASALATGIIALLDLAIDEVSDGTENTSDELLEPDAAGRYLSLWGDVNLVSLPGVMLQLSDTGLDPAGTAVVMHPDDDGALRADAESSFGDAGEAGDLQRDESGRVTAVTITGVTHYRPDVYLSREADMLAP